MAQTYDFVIVGAGPAGCALASRLAWSSKRPKVALIDAGSILSEKNVRVDGERWLTFMNSHMNWGYKTVPQPHLDNRQLDYHRGKGVGGSSAINFACYNIPPSDDFDQIADLVGDKEWDWQHAKERFRSLESFQFDGYPAEIAQYLAPKAADHGDEGALKIGFATVWERQFPEVMDLLKKAGHEVNLDTNSGSNLGFGLMPSSAFRGVRSTAADLLVDAPENLSVIANAPVARVVLSESTGVKRATGVETTSGQTINANHEIILSAGSFDNPKLLMLSGIGDKIELAKHNIPPKHSLPAVGKGMRDHSHVIVTWNKKEGTTDRPTYYRDSSAIDAARKQWEQHGTGPLATFGISLAIGYLKSEAVLKSKEFAVLPEDVKAYLSRPNIPSYEIIANGPDFRDLMSPSTSQCSTVFFPFIMNGQSIGTVTLASSNPADPPLIDPSFLSNPYDKRVAIEAVRECMRIAALDPDVTGPGERMVPESDSEEDIWAFWRANASSTWHATGTVKMGGKDVSETTCVDNDLKVYGIQGLRVADQSVLPVLPSAHTQTTAYFVGATAGDKLVREYDL